MREARVLVLAPHPDDFECIGVSMSRLRDAGSRIELAILTGGASGVEDVFCSPPSDERKAALREEEQRAGCRLFGLPEGSLSFLRLAEDAEGHPRDDDANLAAVQERLAAGGPDLVFLPHPDDSNAGHRRTYRMFARAAAAIGATLTAFLAEDPKTRALRADVHSAFGEELAAFKAELLRCHRSQHERNLRTRGHGLDDRILEVNRRAAERLGLAEPYAEVFQVERWREGRRSGSW